MHYAGEKSRKVGIPARTLEVIASTAKGADILVVSDPQ
jgi:hypothetical protein